MRRLELSTNTREEIPCAGTSSAPLRSQEGARAQARRFFASPTQEIAIRAGRLFDAFAALAGLRQRANYEGQAAIELEGAADGRARGRCYPFTISEAADEEGAMIVDWQPALEQALADVRAGEGVGAVSDALHNGLATAIAALARRIGVHRVALTGGCFQNARLTAATVAALRAAGCEPLWHRRIPPNDGGIALGQAVWAGWTEHRGKLPCA